MIAIMSPLIQRLLALADREIQLAPGQTLFRTGDAVRHVHVVLEGSVRLVRHQAEASISSVGTG